MWWQTDGKYIEFKLNMYYSNFKFCWQPVWLVGGFGGSPWLLKQLQEGLRSTGSTVGRPDMYLWISYFSLLYDWSYSLQSSSAKAVADGNVLFSLGHTVRARYTRTTFGIECKMFYKPSDPEHQVRKHLVFESLDGSLRIPGGYDIIVKKVITKFYHLLL